MIMMYDTYSHNEIDMMDTSNDDEKVDSNKLEKSLKNISILDNDKPKEDESNLIKNQEVEIFKEKKLQVENVEVKNPKIELSLSENPEPK
jgi:hypothetical protein